MVDAGFSSFATFLIGFHAARALTPASLGGYSIFFSAFLVVTVLPAQLLLTPVEIEAVNLPANRRLALLRQSLRIAAPWAVGSAAASLVGVALVPPEVPESTVQALAATVVPVAVLSPLQDHVRRMLHIGQRSWQAALTSIVQAVGAAAALLLLSAGDVPTAAVPFGALTIANAASFTVGWWMARNSLPPTTALATHALLRSGRWLLAVGWAPTVAGLFAATLVGRLAGANALGYAEAARVVAQPLLVVAAGLAAVLGPRLIEAAAQDRPLDTRRYRRVFNVALTGACLCYVALAGVNQPLNPLAQMLPSAYVVSGLVVVTVAANLLNGLAFTYRYHLMGLHKEPVLAFGEGVAGVGQIMTSASAGVTGAFAKPLGLAVLGGVRLIAFLAALRGEGRSTSHSRC